MFELAYVFNVVHNLSRIILVFKQSFDSFPSSLDAVKVFLVALFLLLVLAYFRVDAVFVVQLVEDSLNVKQLALGPMIKIEVGITQTVTQGTHFLLGPRHTLIFNVAEDHL